MNTPGTIIEVNNILNSEEIALVEKFILNMTEGGYTESFEGKEYFKESSYANTIASEYNQMYADDLTQSD